MKSPRHHDARNFAFTELAHSLDPRFLGQALQIRMFGRAQNLDAFLGEIGVEAGERETRTINSRFADLAMKADASAFQFHLQFLRVGVIKTFHRDNWHDLALRTRRWICRSRLLAD